MTPLINNIAFNGLAGWSLGQAVFFLMIERPWHALATAAIGILLCVCEIRHRDTKP